MGKKRVSIDSRNIKRVLSSLLVVTSIMTAVFMFDTGTVHASRQIADMASSSDYARTSIQALADSQIISGDENGNFHPVRTIKRSEMIKMIIGALGADTAILPETPTFQDVPKDNWAYAYIETAYKLGIVKGISNEAFGADRACTREEMAAMFVRAAGITEDKLKGQQQDIFINNMKDSQSISPWAKEYVEFALSTGLMKGVGDGGFAPGGSAQRQQVAVVTDRFITGRDSITRFVDTFNGKMDYPELYDALKNSSSEYKGGLNMNMQLSMRNQAATEFFNIFMGANGMVDESNKKMDVTYNMSMEITDILPLTEDQYRVIMVGDDYYVQYSNDESWTLMDAANLGNAGLTKGNENSQALVKFFRYATVTRQDGLEVEGETAAKYTLSFGKEAINALITELVGDQLAGQQDPESALSGDVNSQGVVTLYINDSNQIIKEEISFNSSMWDEASQENIIMDIILDVHYFNIGQDVNITAPEI